VRGLRATTRTDADRHRRPVAPGELALLAAVTFLPLLLGARGRLNADTKQYLYLDPFDLLERARWLWDPHVGGGTVTHQQLGYLWPMGPYYGLMSGIGVPDWVAQRIWVGGLQFAAAVGALVLFRRLLGWDRLHLAAALLYGLSPFVLGQVTVQSALLLPFAALPWLVWTMVRAVDEPASWRWPAAFALLVTTAGGLNGSSLFFVVVAAVLWVPFGWPRDAGARPAIVLVARTGVLTLACQLWWLVAYSVGGRFGLPILRLTETVGTTNATTSATEVLRGLGYWFFYGNDPSGPWLQGIAPPYQVSPALLVVSFAVPIAAIALGAVARWRGRGYFAVLVALGTVMAVGSFPAGNRSIAGSLFADVVERSDLAFSLRNTQRAGAVVVLGLAGLAAGGLTGVRRWRPSLAPVTAIALALLVAGALPAQWRTGLIAERFHRDDDLPAAWLDAAAHLDEGTGRILEIPGIDFASHRWGHTSDPILAGLVDRPVIARELVPTGGTPGADLLAALDRSMQEGWFEPETLAPVARLLGATDVLVRNDLEYERYRTVRPGELWPAVSSAEAGLGDPVEFGGAYPNEASPDRPLLDETELGLDPDLDHPQLAVLAVPDSGRPLLGAAPVGGATVLAGDGEGVLAAAAAGLVGGDGPILLAADLLRDDGRFEDAIGAGTRYVLTDSNRKRAQRWYTLQGNAGATEPVDGRLVATDPADTRLPVVPDEAPGTRTVVEWRGAERIRADSYGLPGLLLPEERPSNAFDGDPDTAWRAEMARPEDRRWIAVTLPEPIEADHVTLRQPQRRLGTVWATGIVVILDGSRRFEVDVSRADAEEPGGLRVELDGRPFRELEVQIHRVEPARGLAGFSEIDIPGVEIDEVTRVPTGLTERLGARLDDVPLAMVLSRLRVDPAEPARRDPEPAMHRVLSLPVPVELEVFGTARLASRAPGPVLDEILGAGGDDWDVQVRSSEHLPGSIAARPSAALDGDPDTAWTSRFIGLPGEWLEVEADEPLTARRLVLDVVADERHSDLARVVLDTDSGQRFELDLPPLEPGALGTVRTVPLDLPEPARGTVFRITVVEVRPRLTPEPYSGEPVALPVAVAELRLPGITRRPAERPVDTGCRFDLVRVGGAPLPVRIAGTTEDAVGRRGLELTGCNGPLTIGPGEVEITTAPGLDSGIDVDRLVLRSVGGGAAAASDAVAHEAATVEVTGSDPVSASAEVTTDGSPFWVVLDQSMNEAWELDVEGAQVDGPRPLDAFAAGWLVEPDGPGTFDVRASWAPQRLASIALWASALAAALCAALVAWPRRRSPTSGAPTLLAGASLTWAGVRPHPAALVVGVVAAALFVDLLAAPVALVALLAASRWPLVHRLLPAAVVAAACGGVVLEQLVRGHDAAFFWPRELGRWHELALLGVVLLAATAVHQARVPEPREGPEAPG
jgi:arabinofuranan 3-O-arabinosyltransferase